MFDVEVSVVTDPRAVMAVAVSRLAWYSWLSPHFLSGGGFPARVTPDTLVPLGADHSPRLVIGHNVAYDRVRIGDEYRLVRKGDEHRLVRIGDEYRLVRIGDEYRLVKLETSTS